VGSEITEQRLLHDSTNRLLLRDGAGLDRLGELEGG
jgi:hypothetical protein